MAMFTTSEMAAVAGIVGPGDRVVRKLRGIGECGVERGVELVGCIDPDHAMNHPLAAWRVACPHGFVVDSACPGGAAGCPSAAKSPGNARHEVHGFSLVELLVVVVVVVCLAALLLPAMKLAYRSARQMTCMGNLRQLNVGNAIYAEDNNGIYVPVQYWVNGGTYNGYSWFMNSQFKDIMETLRPQAWTSISVSLCCPFSKCLGGQFPIESSTGYSQSSVSNYVDGSYSYQLHKTSDLGLMGKVEFADALFSQVDYNCSNGKVNQYPGYYFGGAAKPEGYLFHCVAYRHSGNANVCFFDGHIEAMSPGSLYSVSVW